MSAPVRVPGALPTGHSCTSHASARDAPRHLHPGPGTPVVPSPRPRSGRAGAALLVLQLQPTWARQLHWSRAGAQLPSSSGLHPLHLAQALGGHPGHKQDKPGRVARCTETWCHVRGRWLLAPRGSSTQTSGGHPPPSIHPTPNTNVPGPLLTRPAGPPSSPGPG